MDDDRAPRPRSLHVDRHADLLTDRIDLRADTLHALLQRLARLPILLAHLVMRDARLRAEEWVSCHIRKVERVSE